MSSTAIPPGRRYLIFIVAYAAEAHLESVFRRIPYDRLPSGSEVIVIDDASPDKTFETGQRAAATCPIPVRVLKNPANLGYGGNQKLGYQIAMEEEFEAVVLLHGDGQYAPELVPEMLAPIIGNEADVVLGSRMLIKKDALAGGMPLYKWIGNQTLTWLENRMLGANLSEFHTGYRAYRVEALRQIPFHSNTNDFHFDTDILIQFFRVGARFLEIPIPTFYGDEICRVNGWRYFFDCLWSCWHDWLTKKGVFYCRRFDFSQPANRYESKLGIPHSSHAEAVKRIPEGSRVLDIGGGSGWVADFLTSSKRCKVTILDHKLQNDVGMRHATILHDLADPIAFDLPESDLVLLLDVLEHLPRPKHVALLDHLRQEFDDPAARMIISVPNTAFLPVRLVFAFLGKLNYGRRGILDDTHLFLFTKASLEELMQDCDYEIHGWHAIPAPYELALGHGRLVGWLNNIHTLAARIFPSMFAYQLLVEASPRPTVSTLVGHSFENSKCARPVGNSKKIPGRS